MPLWLTRNDVEYLLDMPAAIEAVAEAYRLVYQGHAELPVRANIPVAPHDGSLMSMPAYLGGNVDALGAKLISFYGTNPTRRGLPAIQGNVVLFDGRDGALLALMDAGYLTAMRTGASGGLQRAILLGRTRGHSQSSAAVYRPLTRWRRRFASGPSKGFLLSLGLRRTQRRWLPS